MLFQVVGKFGKARGGICLPNILLTPLAPIYGKIGWFLNKCILKHSSLLVSGYWVYGWSSYAGLIGSHPSTWKCSWFGALLTWIDSAGVRVTWGSQFNTLGEGALAHYNFLGELGKLNTKPRLVCIVRLLYSMDVVCKSDDVHQQKNLKGAKLENWLLTPTVVIEEYTPQFWRF